MHIIQWCSFYWWLHRQISELLWATFCSLEVLCCVKLQQKMVVPWRSSASSALRERLHCLCLLWALFCLHWIYLTLALGITRTIFSGVRNVKHWLVGSGAQHGQWDNTCLEALRGQCSQWPVMYSCTGTYSRHIFMELSVLKKKTQVLKYIQKCFFSHSFPYFLIFKRGCWKCG